MLVTILSRIRNECCAYFSRLTN